MAKSVHPEPSKNFGEPIKYDPDFRGPNGRRSCTDILCLGLFFAFIVCWIIIGGYAFMKGDSDLFLVPRDSDGRRCGYDLGVEDKKYLLFIDLTKCSDPKVIFEGCKTPQICVNKCPSENVKISSSNYNQNNIEKYCSNDIPTPKTYTEFEQEVKKGNCAGLYLNSESVTNRCLPGEYTKAKEFLKLSADEFGRMVKNVKYLAAAEEAITLVTQDLIQSWWKILLGLVGAMVVCLMYIILMRWIAGVMVWLSIIGVIVLLSVGVYISATKYKTLSDTPITNTNNQSVWEQKDVWLGILIVVSILLAICVLLLLFLRKRILIAIALIQEASKAVSSTTSTLFFPICPWILQILVAVYAIAVGLYLTSVGTPSYQVIGDSECVTKSGFPFSVNDQCDKNKFSYEHNNLLKTNACNVTCAMTVQKPVYVKIFQAYNIIGALWGIFFMSAFGEMVLAATFATWYWTFRKKDVPYFTLTKGMLTTVRYHLGTLAFGSLIITICRLIRLMIEYIDHKLKKYDNGFVKAMMCCCKCFFWCLENFLKFINKNAYIMCAIHGKNFCTSAKDAFNLLMRNLVRVFVVDKVTDMLLFLAKLLVTGIVGVTAYTAFTNADFNVVDARDLHYALVPVIFISIGTFFIASVFFGVYSMAVDTLFLCFLEDCERNDGSPEKPYFMSKQLMKILGKKNKLH